MRLGKQIFYNNKTGETGNQPTFKASYFGVNIFQQQIILQDMKLSIETQKKLI